MIGQELWQALNQLYHEYPDYIKYSQSTRKKLIVTVQDLVSDESKIHEVTPTDIAKYYITQANNIVSGMRQLSSIIGDWRPIDHLAKECLEIFKLTCPNVLRKEAKTLGLTPKF